MALTVLFSLRDEQFEVSPFCPLSRNRRLHVEMARCPRCLGSVCRAGFGLGEKPSGFLNLQRF